MTILLHKPFWIKVTTKGGGRQKYSKIWPRGLWMTLYFEFLYSERTLMSDSSFLYLWLVDADGLSEMSLILVHKIPNWMWTIDKRRMISVLNRGKQTTTKEVTIRKVPLGGHETDKTIDRWIKDISDLHRSKPPPSVLYTKVGFINYVDWMLPIFDKRWHHVLRFNSAI